MGHVHLSSWLVCWMIPLLVLMASGFVTIHGQLDSHGFISIDCGYVRTPTYVDQKRDITYASDKGFTDAGRIHFVNEQNLQTDLADRYSNVRYFPSGERNCYTLRSLTPGGKYLVRAGFGYGDYDKLNRPPTFDLYLGVSYWTTVTIANSSTAYVFEIIAVSPADFLQICLVNIGSGTPFISWLDLRPLKSDLVVDLYPEANVTHSLVLLSYFRDTVGFGLNRYHFGTNYQHIRSPDDPFDRIWQRYEDVSSWTDVPNKSNGLIQNSTSDAYDAPDAVMRSASTPVNASRMDIYWSSDSSMSVGVDPKFFLLLYFAELEDTQELREFDVSVDDDQLATAFSPKFLLPTVLSRIVQGSSNHTVSLVATSNSVLQPLISAMEIYIVRPVNESTTDSLDANAMMTIQKIFSVKRNWVGDPCGPISLAWDGLNCSYTPSSPPRITGLNMSSNGLVGEINASFRQLTLLQHLDLSHNSLTGSIPDFLGQMSSLKFLDLSSNNLSGLIPWSLREKSQHGSLTLRLDNNPSLCGNKTCNAQTKKKNKTKVLQIVTPVIATVALLFVSVFVLVIWQRRNNRADVSHSANPFENRRFSYKELKRITNNFDTVIGRGGFGLVYAGRLENGASVAVKMRSETSSQGNTEFLAEAQHLARIHHRNLVSLVGYCKDKKHLSLVYDYMDGGNLQDRLRGQEPLNWLQRLKIALDSAYGLEYLHKSCNPPLIHRDVKTGNILLTANLDAKLSDFGLTRAFSSEAMTHTTTQPAGTPGYLDPEYYRTSHLSVKSDVYSFGVVLLVLITGQPAIITVSDTERTNITLWARDRLSEGDIGRVTDPTIREDCDINSVLKVAQLALQCTEREMRDRPTMEQVVEGISESLQLENSSRSLSSSSIKTGTWASADGESVGAI
ncbi:hypothetical protein ACQ4PT_021708 [Festuca glaucescens]